MTALTESAVKHAAVAWLEGVGWQVLNGAEIAPGELAAEPADHDEAVLAQRLCDVLARLNPTLPADGLPLAVLELKNAANEDATIWSAFQQLQTYESGIPARFATNGVLVVSDGVEARVGTFTAGREWFEPWRTISGATLTDAHRPELREAGK
jgi:type I site-specific restriction-modification system R (restriction) subunit